MSDDPSQSLRVSYLGLGQGGNSKNKSAHSFTLFGIEPHEPMNLVHLGSRKSIAAGFGLDGPDSALQHELQKAVILWLLPLKI